MTVRLPHLSFLAPPVLAVMALAACAAPPHPVAGGAGPVKAAAYTPPPALSAPPDKAAPPASERPSLADLARGPSRFEGLAGSDVISALGDPNFRRRETPAEVWQYYGPGCILDLFVYDDAPGAAAAGGKVAHAELRGRDDQPAEAGCLSHLIEQRHNQRAG